MSDKPIGGLSGAPKNILECVKRVLTNRRRT